MIVALAQYLRGFSSAAVRVPFESRSRCRLFFRRASYTHDRNRLSAMRSSLAMASCIILTVLGFWLSSARANDGYTVEELLSVPDVQGYVFNDLGDAAWMERVSASTHLYVARAPAYQAEKLISYTKDDGLPMALVGFDAQGRVLYTRGRAGFNPSHTAFPVAPSLVAAIERQSSPKTLLTDLTGGFAASILSPDRQSLYYASGGDVYSLDLGRRVTKPRALFSTRGRVSSIVPSPDGSRLAFVSNRSNYNRGKYAYVGVFDLDTADITYMEPGLGMDQGISWSPQGDRLAFVRFGYEPRTWRFSNHREGAPFDIMVVNASTGRGAPVFTSEIGYGSRFHGFFASGYSGLGGRGSLQWMANDDLVFPYEKTGWKQLYRVPADGGEVRQITQGAFEVYSTSISADRETLFYLANTEDDLAHLKLYRLGVAEDLTPTRIAIGDSDEMPLSVAAMPSGGIAYELAGGQTPARLIVSAENKVAQKISTGPEKGDPFTRRLPIPEVIEFTARDGLTIEVVMYRPPHISEEGGHPVLVHAHGGPRYQTRPVWNPAFGYPLALRYFAGQGYFVFSVNFRSGTGYGLDFREPDSYGGGGAGDVNDFIDLVPFITENYPEVDPSRMAIYGHSYGGHLVTNALARSDLYVAGISSAGVGDWVVEMEKDFKETLQFNIPERMELEGMAHKSSAISQIDTWGHEPLLLIHGDNDGSAAMQQSLELYHALRRRGIEAEGVIFPGEDHRYQRYASRLRYLEAMETFLEKHLGEPSAK